MLLCVLLDLSKNGWPTTPNPLAALKIFINAFSLSQPKSRILLINSLQPVFDSESDSSLINKIEQFINQKYSQTDQLPVTPCDVGYAILNNPDKIFIFNLTAPDPNHYNAYLKCIFAAKRKNIVIDVYSSLENTPLRICSEGTGGRFVLSAEPSSLLRLLGIRQLDRTENMCKVFCACCTKPCNIGMVCPVCLTIYCKFVPVCKKCKTKFEFTR